MCKFWCPARNEWYPWAIRARRNVSPWHNRKYRRIFENNTGILMTTMSNSITLSVSSMWRHPYFEWYRLWPLFCHYWGQVRMKLLRTKERCDEEYLRTGNGIYAATTTTYPTIHNCQCTPSYIIADRYPSDHLRMFLLSATLYWKETSIEEILKIYTRISGDNDGKIHVTPSEVTHSHAHVLTRGALT